VPGEWTVAGAAPDLGLGSVSAVCVNASAQFGGELIASCAEPGTPVEAKIPAL
jgi:hypothetical protein